MVNVASATTFPNWTQSDLAGKTDALIVGLVERSSIEARETERLWLHLHQVQTLHGNCVACERQDVRVRINPKYFPEAQEAVGNRVMIRVMDRGDHLSVRGGWQSILREENGRILTARRHPIIDIRCDEPSIVARPIAQLPKSEGDLANPIRIFVDEPHLEGEGWEDAVAQLSGCTATTQQEMNNVVR